LAGADIRAPTHSTFVGKGREFTLAPFVFFSEKYWLLGLM